MGLYIYVCSLCLLTLDSSSLCSIFSFSSSSSSFHFLLFVFNHFERGYQKKKSSVSSCLVIFDCFRLFFVLNLHQYGLILLYTYRRTHTQHILYSTHCCWLLQVHLPKKKIIIIVFIICIKLLNLLLFFLSFTISFA